ncbi:LysR family transcriptional regulator [Pseudidiomarina aquimaris]|uniref:LysR family transcriptional regulator n=1 Tax=Pseudidiomarina aquimaris TaxID=641841 RepID=A0A432XBQ0_9GAMM|nr:LysR substrate-binding domain-containing protein [Pseudidiomarina aquimaris]RUO46171.1 LysR family transcriptional regulator [Pseudidiomarina aquimaris]
MRAKSSDIEIFLAVADAGSFTEAAHLLEIEVAQCSRAIKRLEKSLGEDLFTRTTRRIELTNEGQTYLTLVRPALEQLEFAEHKLIEGKQKPQGLLRIDAATPFLIHQVAPHVREFREIYPDIKLELAASEGFIDLIQRKVDVAIRIGALEDSSLHATPLGRSKLHIVASPHYLSKNGKPQKSSDLKNHTKIGFMQTEQLNTWPLDGGLYLPPDIAVSSGELIRRLTLEGTGLACLSNFMIADDIRAGKLVPVLTDTNRMENNPREQVNAVYYRNTALSSRISAFIDFFKPRFTL